MLLGIRRDSIELILGLRTQLTLLGFLKLLIEAGLPHWHELEVWVA